MARGAASCIGLPQQHVGDSIRSDEAIGFHLCMRLVEKGRANPGPIATHNGGFGSARYAVARVKIMRAITAKFRGLALALVSQKAC
jgi:hypothetical protein